MCNLDPPPAELHTYHSSRRTPASHRTALHVTRTEDIHSRQFLLAWLTKGSVLLLRLRYRLAVCIFSSIKMKEIVVGYLQPMFKHTQCAHSHTFNNKDVSFKSPETFSNQLCELLSIHAVWWRRRFPSVAIALSLSNTAMMWKRCNGVFRFSHSGIPFWKIPFRGPKTTLPCGRTAKTVQKHCRLHPKNVAMWTGPLCQDWFKWLQPITSSLHHHMTEVRVCLLKTMKTQLKKKTTLCTFCLNNVLCFGLYDGFVYFLVSVLESAMLQHFERQEGGVSSYDRPIYCTSGNLSKKLSKWAACVSFHWPVGSTTLRWSQSRLNLRTWCDLDVSWTWAGPELDLSWTVLNLRVGISELEFVYFSVHDWSCRFFQCCCYLTFRIFLHAAAVEFKSVITCICCLNIHIFAYIYIYWRCVEMSLLRWQTWTLAHWNDTEKIINRQRV